MKERLKDAFKNALALGCYNSNRWCSRIFNWIGCTS